MLSILLAPGFGSARQPLLLGGVCRVTGDFFGEMLPHLHAFWGAGSQVSYPGSLPLGIPGVLGPW